MIRKMTLHLKYTGEPHHLETWMWGSGKGSWKSTHRVTRRLPIPSRCGVQRLKPHQTVSGAQRFGAARSGAETQVGVSHLFLNNGILEIDRSNII